MHRLSSEPSTPLTYLVSRLLAFFRLESAGGLLLILALIAALAVENSPFSDVYRRLLMLSGEVRVGDFSIDKPVVLWINDLWMAVFFFLVGLEIKSELMGGRLADRSALALPLAAALGGIVVPAGIYVALNHNDPSAMYGWAIPMATDIAFALGIMSLLGNRVPVAAKVFLVTLAIIDDLGAILVIAVFYTANLSVASLAWAGVFVGGLLLLNRLRVRAFIPYLLIGGLLWVCVLKSGVHATLAGVITALLMPWHGEKDTDDEPVNQLMHALHPWVAFLVLPAFAFVNAGISFTTLDWSTLTSSVSLGIILGLVVGKQLGVFGFALVALKLGIAKRPEGVSLMHLYGASALCGIGFTMSLFISGLAFQETGSGFDGADRLAILVASGLSALVGYVVLRLAPAAQGDGELEERAPGFTPA